MSDVREIGQDLHFVREVVVRRERQTRGPWLDVLWAIYVVIGYALLDIKPQWAGMFFAIGGFAGGMLSWYIGRQYQKKAGEIDRSAARRGMAHFFGGIAIAWVFCIGLAVMNESLRGPAGSQVFVVMIGLVYFLWGVHRDRYFLFLGPILMLGGVLVALVPHYGWTSLGLVIALGLVAPRLLHGRSNSVAASTPTSGAV